MNLLKRYKYLIGVLLFSGIAFASGIPQKWGTDILQFGNAGSTDPKMINFDIGDGVLNPAIIVDVPTKEFNFNKALNVVNQKLSVGDRTAADQDIIFDVGLGTANPRFRWNTEDAQLTFSNDGVEYRPIGSGGGGNGDGINLLQDFNFDFELGLTGWTTVGGTSVIEETAPLFGEQSIRVTFTGAGTLTSQLVDVELGMVGGICSSDFIYTWSGNQGELIAKVMDSVGVVLTQSELTPTDSGVVAAFNGRRFICPAGQLKIVIESTVATTNIKADNFFMGFNKNTVAVNNVLQQSFNGDMGSGSGVDFIVRNFQNITYAGSDQLFNELDTTTGLITFKRDAFIVASGYANSLSSTAGPIIQIDGVSVARTNANTSTVDESVSYTGYITAGQTLGFGVSNSSLNNYGVGLTATAVESNIDTAINLETSGALFKGHHNTDCTFVAPPGSAGNHQPLNADTTCTFDVTENRGFRNIVGANTPKINLDFPYFGDFMVCGFTQTTTVTSGRFNFGLYVNNERGVTGSVWIGNNITGSQTINICDIVKITSTSNEIEIRGFRDAGSAVRIGPVPAAGDTPVLHWSIFPITQNMPAPVFPEINDALAERVTSVSNTVIHSCFFDFLPSPSAFTILDQAGTCGWVDSTTRLGVGRAFINIKPGTFTGRPNCFATYREPETSTSPAPRSCSTDTFTQPDTNRVGVSCRAGSAVSAGFLIDASVYVICHGSK